MTTSRAVEQERRLAFGRAFDSAQDGLREEISAVEYEKRKHDFAFHLTECLDDLEGLAAWVRDPLRGDEDEAVSNLMGMLYHVIPHLKEAGRLLLDEIPDAFDGSNNRPGVS